MISLKKINNVIIKPIPDILTGGSDHRKVKGHDMFSEPYANIFCLAKKKSGKTTTIFNILKNCVGKNTNVIIFASTVNKDKSYKAIKTYLKLKNIPCVAYTEFVDEDKNNILQNIMNKLKDEEPEEEDEETKPKKHFNMYGQEEEEEKEKKEKYLAPEFIFILDDLSTAMRHPTIQKLLKTNRHYKSKVIISSQYLTDLEPATLRQMDYFLIFGGQSEEKLKLLHQYSDLAIDYETFEKIYHNATSEKYNFLYIDVNNEMRKNFNLTYNI